MACERLETRFSYKEKTMFEPIITKQCYKCKRIKPIVEFYKQKSQKDGFKSHCKICSETWTIQYRKTEKGMKAVRFTMRKYRKSEKGKAYQKQYYQTEKRKEVSRLANKKYRQNNPEKIQAQNAVQYAMKIGNLLCARNFQCFCGKQAQHYHHSSYAPEHWLDVIAVCIPCHRKVHF